MRSIALATTLTLAQLGAHAEEQPSTAFTLAAGVTLVQQTKLDSATKQSVRIRKAAAAYEVLVTAFMPCGGAVAPPWLTAGSDPTLVVEKVRSSTIFNSREECTYMLKVSVSPDRLEPKGTLYVVSGQTVVGHATVP